MSALYKAEYSRYLRNFSDYSVRVFEKVTTASNLAEAMKYSFFAGGKRIRPVLMLACSEYLGGRDAEVLPFAFALECVHTYSLIHDDLPALDNDVLRRGKPTCHTKFDEATAILAGDALLNLAFEHILSNIYDKRGIEAAKIFADYAGFSGMLGGQKSDIEHEKSGELNEDVLNGIYSLKTGRFLTLPFLVPTMLFKPALSADAVSAGGILGKLFQYADDLSDEVKSSLQIGKSAGKDKKADKLTAVKVYGADGVKSEMKELLNNFKEKAKSLINSEFISGFIEEITEGLL